MTNAITFPAKRAKSGAGRYWAVGMAGGAALIGLAGYRALTARRRAYRSDTSDDRRRPSWAKLIAEAPAAARLVGAHFLPVPIREPHRGRGRPVLVLPAFLANDLPTLLLRRTLKACGFRPFGWLQGLNLGVRADLLDRLEARLDQVLEEAGGPVALIGWSLGGLYARELAKRRPQDVLLVITLGTPFAVDLRDNNAWKLYEAINDHPVDGAPIEVDVAEKPPVHTVAIWSRRDGIVAPASASGRLCQSDEQLEVSSKHNELVSNPAALRLVVDVLDRRA